MYIAYIIRNDSSILFVAKLLLIYVFEKLTIACAHVECSWQKVLHVNDVAIQKSEKLIWEKK